MSGRVCTGPHYLYRRDHVTSQMRTPLCNVGISSCQTIYEQNHSQIRRTSQLRNSNMNTSANHRYIKQYRDAIALNNTAVALLERDYFKDAVDMLQIALYLVQLTFCSVGSFDPITALPNKIQVTDDDITRYLINAVRCQCDKRCSLTLKTNVDVLFVSTQHNIGQVGKILSKAQQRGTKAVFIYVVIEPIDFDEVDLDSVYHDSMLILYNFGVAHCSSAAHIERSTRLFDDRYRWILVHDLRQAACQMFTVIEAYIGRMWSGASASENQESGLLTLSALLCYAKAELALHLHYTTANEYCNVTFTAILKLIDRHCKNFPNSIPQAPAA